ncbi:MAG: PadR family transcriptional regulator [Lentilactobacillus diolivorans]|uniref:Transcriptional regulator n=2 Tax=Lentilactobacillus diolivorans TaxID=179838 RepID=A0A0R1SDZ5_9LACO|nr:PadR family transcriptional regulator [Lentilactobacillus diolivorans]KRL64778.1 transcriptional regulator [Lentilactobacillus diolivorans DSM 14421]GEP24675.1 transcriptional regulator [Lentilactobacillus diolivorans]
MYELLILGLLMSRDVSGYKLRIIFESSLVPRREISNGVMYPLLQKLSKKGYIEFIENTQNPRNEKLAHITQTGINRFQQLMAAEVPNDAKRESIWRFKFRGMAGVDPQTQQQILTDYENAVATDFNVYTKVKQHLSEKLADPDSNQPYLVWAIRSLDLSISICHAKTNWIDNCRQKMKNDKENLDE